jgi:hypothetical protein
MDVFKTLTDEIIADEVADQQARAAAARGRPPARRAAR